MQENPILYPHCYHQGTQELGGKALGWETGEELEEVGMRGGAGRERLVLCPWGRSSQPRRSSRCVLREVFGDLAKPSQDGRWQEAPEHLFVSWLRICHV